MSGCSVSSPVPSFGWCRREHLVCVRDSLGDNDVLNCKATGGVILGSPESSPTILGPGFHNSKCVCASQDADFSFLDLANLNHSGMRFFLTIRGLIFQNRLFTLDHFVRIAPVNLPLIRDLVVLPFHVTSTRLSPLPL